MAVLQGQNLPPTSLDQSALASYVRRRTRNQKECGPWPGSTEIRWTLLLFSILVLAALVLAHQISVETELVFPVQSH